ncbi:hypothetical protein ACVRWL_00500 [Streptococcus ratti]
MNFIEYKKQSFAGSSHLAKSANPIMKNCQLVLSSKKRARKLFSYYLSVNAAKPGNTLPSSNSINAPPPRRKYLHYHKKGELTHPFC